MAYTPELTMESSTTLRRIAWALGVPMTQAIERVFDHLPEILDREKVCEACRDPRCARCKFQNEKGPSTSGTHSGR